MKLELRNVAVLVKNVAPYVGAWIETWQTGKYGGILPVAPYVGAWIETDFTSWC